MLVSIDGASSTGKGTLAKMLASHFHLAHIDSGLLYRKAALLKEEEKEITFETLSLLRSTEILRSEETASKASKIACDPFVRHVINEFMRDQVQKEKTCVIDGRDIGTVVFPHADIKFFLLTEDNIKAQRRQEELKRPVTAQTLKERDKKDTQRRVAPLTQPLNAHVIDTSLLTKEEVFQKASKILETYRARRNSQ